MADRDTMRENINTLPDGFVKIDLIKIWEFFFDADFNQVSLLSPLPPFALFILTPFHRHFSLQKCNFIVLQ